MRKIESYGYPRDCIIEGIHKGDLNQATASYNLLALS